MVWNDTNANGLREPDEPGLRGAIVTLWQGDVALQSLVTGEDGRYTFPDLEPGEYRVVETDPPGHRSTTVSAAVIEVGCGEKEQDFGDQLATECLRGANGVVWNDVDGDGVLEAGEPPLAGATLTLRDSAGAVVGVQVTTADGVYLFDELGAEVHTLVEENPPGFPESTTLDNWVIDLILCRETPVTINFGDRVPQ